MRGGCATAAEAALHGMMNGRLFTVFALGALPLAPAAAQVEASGSRPVVQPLPSPAVGDLNTALRRIARNPRDVEGLVAAGFASLKLDDLDAAVGFFARAQEVEPGNAQVKLGLANAYLRSDRPVEALQLYAEAERAGASSQAMAADRGLAFDLVGDNAAAQQEYARALNGPEADEVRRRLALSQAIQGNREGFERTLYPLLEKQDFAAYRARAFALAILGQESEAVAITEAVMPAELAARLTPYLNFMRRLTPAQQAAAANLGNFPRAAQIGRDDPRIAAYRSAASGLRTADSALAPSGPPLGAAPPAATGTALAAATQGAPAAAAAPAQTAPTVQAQQIAQPAAEARPVSPPPARLVVAEPAPSASSVQSPPTAAPEPVPSPAAQPVTALAPSRITPMVPPASAASQPGFDLARVDRPAASEPAGTAPAAAALPAASAPVSLLPRTEPASEPVRVAQAFADLAASPATVVPRTAGAVDITRIRPPREVEKKPEPEAAKPPPPPPPAHPSRHWVQLATGRDKAALKFDWRRFASKAPEVLGKLQPHVTPWGQANRLLAGPYESARAANTALAALKKQGLDAFTFTSEVGQAVERLR